MIQGILPTWLLVMSGGFVPAHPPLAPEEFQETPS
jgi:hypothetical protein